MTAEPQRHDSAYWYYNSSPLDGKGKLVNRKSCKATNREVSEEDGGLTLKEEEKQAGDETRRKEAGGKAAATDGERGWGRRWDTYWQVRTEKRGRTAADTWRSGKIFCTRAGGGSSRVLEVRQRWRNNISIRIWQRWRKRKIVAKSGTVSKY